MGKLVQRSAIAAAMFAIAGLVPLAGQAGSIDVYVGYADSLRPSPFFPSPYDTADHFQGNLGSLDTGAVMVVNTGATNVQLDSLTVTLDSGGGAGGPYTFALWTFPLVLLPGEKAVFASTSNYNFDTSDFGVLGALAPNNDNCSVGPTAATAQCINNAPLVILGFDLNPAVTYTDSGHVLDTGGFDFVNANPCPVAGDTPGNCNESLQWRLIGTTGIQDPGGRGTIPEPATLALFGLGLAGLGAMRRRRVA